MFVRQYANQRQVTVHKVGSKRTYTRVDTIACRKAMRHLGHSTFLLYMYFVLNADGFDAVLSPRLIKEVYGISSRSYYRAFDELLEKRYLVPRDASRTMFDFYEDVRNLADPHRQNGTDVCQDAYGSLPNWQESILYNTIETEETSPAGQPEGFPAQVGEQAAAAEVESFFLDL